VRVVIGGIVLGLFRVLFDFGWWKLAHEESLKEYNRHASLVLAAVMYAKKFIGILGTTLISIVEEVLRINHITVTDAERQRIDRFVRERLESDQSQFVLPEGLRPVGSPVRSLRDLPA